MESTSTRGLYFCLFELYNHKMPFERMSDKNRCERPCLCAFECVRKRDWVDNTSEGPEFTSHNRTQQIAEVRRINNHRNISRTFSRGVVLGYREQAEK